MAPRIAIIDDDAGLRQSLSGLLRSLGYVVEEFAAAEHFLDRPIGNEPSCIITDMKMPGIHGDALQARLIASGRRIPMIFVTAYPQEATRSRVLAAGAAGFLTKPFQQKNLIDCLRSALATSEGTDTQVSAPPSG